MSHRLALCWIVIVTACSEPPHTTPDASVVPRSPEGTFAVTTRLELAAPIPGPAAAVVGDLIAMTDGPDDPSRYIIDRVVASLPEGTPKTAARALAPFVAAYLNSHLITIAPRFVSGIHAISDGLDRVARHFTTIETVRISREGAVRTIGAIRFDIGVRPIDIAWSVDPGAAMTVTLDRTGKLVFGEHVVPLTYGRMLRVALDTAVIPSIDPAATDLSSALRGLIDCAQLGKLVASKVGLGGATLYEAACATGMTAAASDFYRRLALVDGAPLELHMTGTAQAVDVDGNGTMDAFDTGNWKGTLGYGTDQTALGPTLFSGSKQ